MSVQFEGVYVPKVHEILRQCRRPLVVVNAVADCVYRVSFRRNRPLKLPLNCEVVAKRWFWGSRFVGDGIP